MTTKQELKSNVDWLTEVIKRFSESYLAQKDLTTCEINMLDTFRLEKVCFALLASRITFLAIVADLLTLAFDHRSGSQHRRGIRIENGTKRKRLRLSTQFFNMELSSALCAMKSELVLSPKSSGTTDIGRRKFLALYARVQPKN